MNQEFNPDHRCLFDAADQIYDEPRLNGYRVQRHYSDPDTGFKAALLKPAMSGSHGIFTVCGTQWWEDHRLTIRDALADLNMGIDQYRSPAGQALLADATDLARDGVGLAFTGHSLGDSLGKTFAYFVLRQLDAARQTASSLHAVGFAGFGAKELISALDDDGFDADVSARTRALTYFIAADPIPRIGTHTGETRRIPEDALLPEAVAQLDFDFEEFDTSRYGLLGIAWLHHRPCWRHVVHGRKGLERARPETPEQLAWATRLGDPTNRLPELDQVKERLRNLAEDNQTQATRLYDAVRRSMEQMVEKHRNRADELLTPVGERLSQSVDRLLGDLRRWTETRGDHSVIRSMQAGLNLMVREGASDGDLLETDGKLDDATRNRLNGAMDDMGPSAMDRVIWLGRLYLFLKESDPERWTNMSSALDAGDATLALQKALNRIGRRRLAAHWVALAEDGDPGWETAAACRAVIRSIGAERLALAYGHGLGLY